jgi:hypothetical protein
VAGELRWFEIDVTWWTIKVMAAMRLVDKVRVPTRQMRDRLAAAQAEVQRRYIRRLMLQ